MRPCVRVRAAETSKHYGPYCTALPDALTPLLDRYADALALEGEGGDEAYLFGPNHALDRPYESAAWSMAVKRAFAKHSPAGREVAPKVLRSSFITWVRSETDCPAVLKAAAHAQKHSEQRQQSESYECVSTEHPSPPSVTLWLLKRRRCRFSAVAAPSATRAW